MKVWWKFKKIRSAVSSYFYHKEQYEEWKLRYVADDVKTKQKQQYHLIKHKQGMKDALRFIEHREHLPMDTWLPVGKGMEICLNTHYHIPLEKQLERRWI